MVFNGKPTREWLSREVTSNTTASVEGIFLTETIDAYEGRDIIVLDVPSALIHTNMVPNKYGEEGVITKIANVMVYMLLELDADK